MMLHLWTIFRARWLLVLGAALAGAGVGYLLDNRLSSTHTVYGQIELPAENARSRISGATVGGGYTVEAPLIGSGRILNRIVNELNLTRSRHFMGSAPASRTTAQQDELRLFAVARLRAGLRVSVVTGTRLARVEYTDADAELARSIVNTAMDDYIADRYERRYASAHDKSLIMAAGMEQLRQQVSDMQQRLLRMQQDLGSPGFTPRNNPYEDTLADLERRSTRARLDRLSAAAKAESLRTNLATHAGADQTASDANGQAVATLRLQLSTTRSEQARLQAVLGPKHPELEAMEAQTADLRAQLDAEYRRGVEIADAQVALAKTYENELAAALAAHKGNMNSLQAAFTGYANLEREFVFTRRLYLAYYERLRTGEADAAFSQDEVSVVDRAFEIPWTPPVSVWFALWSGALVASFLTLGVCSVLRVESSPERRLARLADLSGAPVLATTPRIHEADKTRLTGSISGATHAAEQSSAAGGFVQGIFDLRAHLEEAAPMAGRGRYLLFTSALPSEGKTTVSSNLAVAMARHGAKVLLIDADLRRPAVHRHFGISGAIGVTSVLRGKVSLQQAVQTIPGTDRLDVLASGPLPPDASNTLASAEMLELLRCAGRLYSTVIVDSPPVLATSDALALSQWTDATVWVIRDGRPTRGAILRARQLMASYGTQPVGILVNGINSTAVRLSDLRREL